MASQMEPFLALNIEYLRTRQDRRKGRGLGRIYDPAAGTIDSPAVFHSGNPSSSRRAR
jgi:hypothetical protein